MARTGPFDPHRASYCPTVVRHTRLRELLVGVEGLALLRRLYDGTDDEADQRLAEVRRLLDDEAYAAGEPTAEAGAQAGYAAWAPSYDEPGNQIVALEQPVVWSLLDGEPPGRALDAACGTGRHAAHLLDRGHRVVGTDFSREMMLHAPTEASGAGFVQADLLGLPLREASFDLAVSGLALAHVADLATAVRELARVLVPGGRLVVSVLHPFQAFLAWNAPFRDEQGRRWFVREHAHTHGDYIDAFTAAGLQVESCVEPALGMDAVQAKQRAYRHIPDATAAAYLGLPAVLVWKVRKVRSAALSG